MRLGTSSPLAHKNPEEWAKKHKDLGLSAINFPLNFQEDARLLQAYIKAAKENNLILAEVGVWRNTMDPDEGKRKEAIAYTIGQLELADQIGAACCVNILGSRGNRWDGACKENYSMETWNLGVKTIREIIDAVKPKNTYFTIEPMPWMYPMGPDEYVKLLEEVDRERFAVHMDVFNWMTSPQRYFMNEEFIEECFDKLGHAVKSCHLKNVHLEENYTIHFKETCVDKGGVNIKHLIETGEKYNPQMPFIIEHLDTDEEYLESINYIQKLMRKAQ